MPAARRARLADFRDARGSSIDQGLALYFPAPASFTGEHVLELQGHGGPLVMDLLVQRVLGLGCRMARPGEFSERAFLNGKIDIAQAEAVADLIDAGTAAAARAAVRSMRGEFSARIGELQSQLTELRAYVETAIDFPDEEIDFLSAPAVASRLTQIFRGFDSIHALARQGTLLREGLTVVIAGKPNAGKSSLLNRLVGDEVAIVTAAPGTTRDVLRQHLHLDGLPLNLIDTAGLRTAIDAAEAEGVRRARSEMRQADRVLYVLDASVADERSPAQLAAEIDQLPREVPATLIFNKIDLTGTAAHAIEEAPARIFLSARTGAGLDLLRAHLKASAGYRDSGTGALAARRGIMTHWSARRGSCTAPHRLCARPARSSCLPRTCGSHSARSARSPVNSPARICWAQSSAAFVSESSSAATSQAHFESIFSYKSNSKETPVQSIGRCGL